jgi:hypothetical protein
LSKENFLYKDLTREIIGAAMEVHRILEPGFLESVYEEADVIVVELKALSQLGDNEKAQIINYLKATRLPVGLLLNFGTQSLEYKRFANTKSAVKKRKEELCQTHTFI